MQVTRLLVAALVGLATMAGTRADSWPSKPIRWIVPYPAGGGTDVVSRAVGAKLSDALHQPIVIDNRPGANTILGTHALAQAPGDGYTIALITDAHSINQASGKPLPYDSERDFLPILQLLRVPFMLVVNSELVPMRTLPELIKHAKENPGWLTFGSLGPGSPHEIAMSWFKTMAGLDLLIVPYRGISPALQDVVAGHVKSMLIGVAVADELVQSARGDLAEGQPVRSGAFPWARPDCPVAGHGRASAAPAGSPLRGVERAPRPRFPFDPRGRANRRLCPCRPEKGAHRGHRRRARPAAGFRHDLPRRRYRRAARGADRRARVASVRTPRRARRGQGVKDRTRGAG